jgi:RNA polymerase sigma-70 factor (ECF subfamily)
LWRYGLLLSRQRHVAEDLVQATCVRALERAGQFTQRETVFLTYVEGLSYREVAEVLQVPIGTVMSRLATARAKLAEYPPLHTVPNPSTGERR